MRIEYIDVCLGLLDLEKNNSNNEWLDDEYKNKYTNILLYYMPLYHCDHAQYIIWLHTQPTPKRKDQKSTNPHEKKIYL